MDDDNVVVFVWVFKGFAVTEPMFWRPDLLWLSLNCAREARFWALLLKLFILLLLLLRLFELELMLFDFVVWAGT